MKLNDDIIRLAYYFAGRVVGKRKNLSHEDIAHDALERIARYKAPPDGYIIKFVKWQVLACYREFYTNLTGRKHDVMLEKQQGDMAIINTPTDGNQRLVDLADTAREWFYLLNEEQEVWALKCMLAGKTLREMAAEDGRCQEAMRLIRKRVRETVREYLCQAC